MIIIRSKLKPNPSLDMWAQKLLLYDCNAITTIYDYQARLFSTSYIVHVLTYSHFFEINEFQLMVCFNRLGK